MAPCHLRVERFDAGRRLVPASARHPVHPDRLVRRRVIRTPLSRNLRLTPATMRFRSATLRVSEFSKGFVDDPHDVVPAFVGHETGFAVSPHFAIGPSTPMLQKPSFRLA